VVGCGRAGPDLVLPKGTHGRACFPITRHSASGGRSLGGMLRLPATTGGWPCSLTQVTDADGQACSVGEPRRSCPWRRRPTAFSRPSAAWHRTTARTKSHLMRLSISIAADERSDFQLRNRLKRSRCAGPFQRSDEVKQSHVAAEDANRQIGRPMPWGCFQQGSGQGRSLTGDRARFRSPGRAFVRGGEFRWVGQGRAAVRFVDALLLAELLDSLRRRLGGDNA
jgi:hypothetical protein